MSSREYCSTDYRDGRDYYCSSPKYCCKQTYLPGLCCSHESPSSDDGMNIPILIGSVVGAVIFVSIVSALIRCCCVKCPCCRPGRIVQPTGQPPASVYPRQNLMLVTMTSSQVETSVVGGQNEAVNNAAANNQPNGHTLQSINTPILANAGQNLVGDNVKENNQPYGQRLPPINNQNSAITVHGLAGENVEANYQPYSQDLPQFNTPTSAIAGQNLACASFNANYQPYERALPPLKTASSAIAEQSQACNIVEVSSQTHGRSSPSNNP